MGREKKEKKQTRSQDGEGREQRTMNMKAIG